MSKKFIVVYYGDQEVETFDTPQEAYDNFWERLGHAGGCQDLLQGYCLGVIEEDD